MLRVNPKKDYRNYKWFVTSDGNLVIGGKSDEQNELVVKNFLKPDYTIMHTSAPGSPFMIIQTEKPTKKDLDETAIFTGCFSKQWKNGNARKSKIFGATKSSENFVGKKIDVDVFKGSQIYKKKSMKMGTFGVQGEKQTIKIKPELVLVIQKGKFRAVPKTTKEKKLAEIKPGKLSKEDASKKIAKIIRDKFHLPVHKDEIMQAIPSDKLSVK